MHRYWYSVDSSRRGAWVFGRRIGIRFHTTFHWWTLTRVHKRVHRSAKSQECSKHRAMHTYSMYVLAYWKSRLRSLYVCINAWNIWFDLWPQKKKNMFDRHDFTIMFTTRYIALPGILLLILHIYLEKGYATN